MTTGRPIYTPKQLMKEGLNAGAGKFMMVMFNPSFKPSQLDMLRGGNWRSNQGQQFTEKVVTNEDGSTRTIQVPLMAKPQDAQKYLGNPEFFNKIDFVEYQGPYHTYPNGHAMTGASFNEDDSVPLIPYTKAIEMSERIDHILAKKKKPIDRDSAQSIPQTENADEPVRSPNNSIYFKLTGRRFDRYFNPKYYYPDPTDEDYQLDLYIDILHKK